MCWLASILKSIQGACRLSLKIGREDEKCNVLCMGVINIDFRSSQMAPLPNNGTLKSVSWTFACRLNIL